MAGRRVVWAALLVAVLAASCTESDGGAEAVASAALTSSVTTTLAVTTTSVATTAPPSSSSTSSTTAFEFFEPKTEIELCLERAVFGDPVESDYVLPFPAGTGYTMFQGYCRDDTSHEEQVAYDFAMPIGSQVTAARAGIVRDLREDVSDTAFTSDLNFITIEHEDGSAAFYGHVMQDSIPVAIGDEVEAGDLIALSGSSGRTGEILHFGVSRIYPWGHHTDTGVNFRNADGPLNRAGGLRDGSFYRATPDGET
ncbi:MAG: M23 family metallopeptidase [bacterium]|nr:M23 family metallopeptidase [bacterium]